MTGKSNTPAVLYAAKSTADPRGSIPTQLADCRAAAEAEGREIVDEYSDEAASAYSGNRGPGLVKARQHAERLGAELWVQHSDRLARGDGKTAMHLVEHVLWAFKVGVSIRSVQDNDACRDLLYAVVNGQRNNEDSKRKGAAVSAGQRRRFESGKRLGSPIRDGYKLQLIEAAGGRPVQEAVIDPERAPIIRRIFDMVEKGHTPGEIRQALNAEGIRNRRGKPWTTRMVRNIMRDAWWYAGKASAYGEKVDDDHEALIDPERWERIAAMVASGPRARTVESPPRDWLLQGIASCHLCGSPLYTRSDRHTYVCKAVRESRGTCNALPIPAEAAERLVLDHLDCFIHDVEEWLSGQAREAVRERDQFAKSLEGQRRELRKLDLRAQRANELADKLLDDGDDETAAAALRKAESTRTEYAAAHDSIEAAEAKLADWSTVPDVDAALDAYTELSDAVQGRLRGSKSVAELRAHLRATMAEARLEYDGGELVGAFILRVAPGKLSRAVALGSVLGSVCEPIEIPMPPTREAADTTS
jgi:DNA invertase Pin-like site-specific DNA recombinase